MLFSSQVVTAEIVVYEDHYFDSENLRKGSLSINTNNGEFIKLDGDLVHIYQVCGDSLKYYCILSDIITIAIPKDWKESWSFDGYKFYYADELIMTNYQGEQKISVVHQKRDSQLIMIYFIKNERQIIGFTDNINYKYDNRKMYFAINSNGLDLEEILNTINTDRVLNKRQFNLLLDDMLNEEDGTIETKKKRMECLFENICN